MRDPLMTSYTPKMIEGVTPEEVLLVEQRAVSCDGGPGALGHPLIWMRIEDHQVTCPYCSRTYRLAEGAGDDGQH